MYYVVIKVHQCYLSHIVGYMQLVVNTRIWQQSFSFIIRGWCVGMAVQLTVLCTLIHCTVSNVQCVLCCVHCKLFTVQCALYTVHCRVCTVHCELYCNRPGLLEQSLSSLDRVGSCRGRSNSLVCVRYSPAQSVPSQLELAPARKFKLAWLGNKLKIQHSLARA